MLKISPRVSLYSESEPLLIIDSAILVLRQATGEAFGDGSHPTTRLCAGAIDTLCRQQRRISFLDVGTGTGILARIARARGSEFIIATDIDPIALISARLNASFDRSPVAIEITNLPPDHWGPRFDLVVANILEGPLRELSPALARSMAPDGVLLISGFTRMQVPSLRVAFHGVGLTLQSEASLEGWTLLQFSRKPGS